MGMTVAEAGRRGGKARAEKLSKERRIEIAKLGYKSSSLSLKRKSKKKVLALNAKRA